MRKLLALAMVVVMMMTLLLACSFVLSIVSLVFSFVSSTLEDASVEAVTFFSFGSLQAVNDKTASPTKNANIPFFTPIHPVQ